MLSAAEAEHVALESFIVVVTFTSIFTFTFEACSASTKANPESHSSYPSCNCSAITKSGAPKDECGKQDQVHKGATDLRLAR